MNSTAIHRLAPWVTALAFLVLWWLFVLIFHIESFVLPSPVEAFAALYEFRYALLKHGLATLSTTLAGFALSVVFGLILGVLVGSFKSHLQFAVPAAHRVQQRSKSGIGARAGDLVWRGHRTRSRNGLSIVFLSGRRETSPLDSLPWSRSCSTCSAPSARVDST